MPPVANLGTHLISAQCCSRGALVLVLSLLFNPGVQGGQSSPPQRRQSDSIQRLQRPFGVEAQRQLPNSQEITGRSRKKPAVAKVQPRAATTTMPLFLEPPQYPTGRGPTSLAVGDFNSDGKSDLVVANSIDDSMSILLANGDGSFQAHIDSGSSTNPSLLVVGDFNVDGKLDVAVANRNDSTLYVLLGNGDGTFQAPISSLPKITSISSLALGDFNGDGKPDLVASGWGNGTVVLGGNGDGTFQEQWSFESLPPSDRAFVATGDFNGDGKQDLVVSSTWHSTGYLEVWRGNGDGTFVETGGGMVGREGYSIAGPPTVSDLNGDGKADLVVGNATGISVLLGNGDGTFQPYVEYPGGSGYAAVGNFNGDDTSDLAVMDGDNTLSLLLGNGDGTFQKQVHYAIGPVAVGDFNGDGKLDLAATNYWNNSVSVLPGNGDGTFPAYLSNYQVAGPYQSLSLSSLAVADFNRDGTPDLALGEYCSGTACIYPDAQYNWGTAMGRSNIHGASLPPPRSRRGTSMATASRT